MASNRRIRGITIEIGGDTTKLDKALSGTNKELNETQKALKDVERLLKLDPGNTELLAQKQRLLAQSVETTTQRLNTLRQAAQNADKALQNGSDYKAAYEPLKEQLDSVSASMRGMEANAESMKQKLAAGDISTAQYEAFEKKLEDTRKTAQDLEKAIENVNKEFAGAKIDQSQYDALQREIIETEASLKDLEKQSKDTSSGMDRFNTAIGKVSTTAGKIKNVMMPVSSAIIGVGAAALATVPATEEFRADLSRLDTNAQQAGVSLEATRQAFMNLNAVSGETDSSIEAVSNLLQAGFTESNLQKAVEGLANAAITFPDTIRIESLADSLQETLATGEATGQFAELLDRMGIGAETFSEGLSMCTTEIDKQNYALNALVGGPLRDTYNSWMQNNQQLVESRDASLELQTALAQLAEQLVPVVTTIAEFASSFLNWFTSLDDGAQGAIVAVGLLIAAIGPLAGIIESVSAVMPTLINLFSGLNTKMLGISIVAAVLVGLFAAVAGAWEDMSGLEKVVSVLGLVAAAALTAAIAVGAFQSALTIGIAAAGIVAGIVAVVAAINSAQQRAEQATQNLERQSSRSSYSVPAFANGGVVPPNDPFLAVLGDNRTEPEVVAPYSTIKQAASDAIAERGSGTGGMAVADIYLDGAKVGRGIFPYLENERIRVGSRLVGGAANGGTR